MIPSSLFVVFIVAASSHAVFICPRPNGLFSDTSSSKMFYHCLNYIPYHKPCPSGTLWSQTRQRCLSISSLMEPITSTVPVVTTTVPVATTTTTVATTTTTVATTTTTVATTTTTVATTTTTVATTTTTVEELVNGCSKGNPCQNGGSCEPSGKDDLFCLCQANYYGSRCEHTGEGTDLSVLESIIDGNNNNYEHVVENVLSRNNWTDILAVVDVTGSMQSCAAAVYKWMKLSQDKTKNIRYYVFFNDGDDKLNSGKVIGSTGGIYSMAANNLNKVLSTMESAMKNGNGGDIPENDIEAILHGIDMCPTCKDIIHIADNKATPRDLQLLNRVTKPVKVLTCQVDVAGVNPKLLTIADKTNGSLHTLDQDIVNLSKIKLDEKITIGRREYRRTSSGFVLESYNSMSAFQSTWDTDLHEYRSTWDTDVHEYRSTWDESPSEENKQVDPPNAEVSLSLIKIQLIGVAVVLLLILATVLPLTFILTGISTNATATARIAKSFELESLICGNMEVFESADFSGSDLATLPSMNYNTCCASCLKTAYCIGFTLNNTGQICYQKKSIDSTSRYDVNFISAKY
ncbi:unnamed protein product [Rotaria socialis]|uniref:Uncharacterized protein n=1 Tax=Rotaria socialis TaxID=392032 RepID=A0A820SZQ0_9BILA|nr:unnamed protein product [Rotaria socialis]CAF4461726.1 unnamed protein product [Rotaria socialis]CAF4485192.1 unnamed protein product [Rotaria socialis]